MINIQVSILKSWLYRLSTHEKHVFVYDDIFEAKEDFHVGLIKNLYTKLISLCHTNK